MCNSEMAITEEEKNLQEFPCKCVSVNVYLSLHESSLEGFIMKILRAMVMVAPFSQST